MFHQITITLKNVYGNELMYPACEAAYWLARLAGSKTLTKQHLAYIQNMGYEVLVDNNAQAFDPRKAA